MSLTYIWTRHTRHTDTLRVLRSVWMLQPSHCPTTTVICICICCCPPTRPVTASHLGGSQLNGYSVAEIPRERRSDIDGWTMAIFGSHKHASEQIPHIEMVSTEIHTWIRKTKDRSRSGEVLRAVAELLMPTGCRGDFYSSAMESLDYIYICTWREH